MGEESNIYTVRFKYTNGFWDQFKNFGDNYGEVYEGTEFVVAEGQSDAIFQVLDKMKEEIRLCNEAWKEAQEKADEAGDSSNVRRYLSARFIFPPNIPTKISEWRAEVFTVPGFRIKLEKNED